MNNNIYTDTPMQSFFNNDTLGLNATMQDTQQPLMHANFDLAVMILISCFIFLTAIILFYIKPSLKQYNNQQYRSNINCIDSQNTKTTPDSLKIKEHLPKHERIIGHKKEQNTAILTTPLTTIVEPSAFVTNLPIMINEI